MIYREIERAVVTCASIVLLCIAGVVSAQEDLEGGWRQWSVVESGTATQTALGVDLANNVYIASIVDDRLEMDIIRSNQQIDVSSVGTSEFSQGDPDIATNALGFTFMTFTQLDSSTPAEGREIYFTDNQNQDLTDIENISDNRVDDYAPKIALDRGGEPHLVWAQRVGDETRVMYWHRKRKSRPEFVVAGDYPAVFVCANDVVHISYSRDNDLFYISNDGGTFDKERNERPVVSTPDEVESPPSLGADSDGNVFVQYESRNTLYYATAAPGDAFGPPRLLDTGGVFDPKLRVRNGGNVAMVYAKQGDMYSIVGRSNTLNLPPQRILRSNDVESKPGLDIDHLSNIHLSFIRDGNVFYINNSSAPTAEFAADPPAGEAPLSVRFTDLSSGEIELWNWDFGDGTTSNLPEPVHVYKEPGKYDVTLTVTAAGGRSATVTRADAVFAQTPLNSMDIPNQVVLPGQADVWFPVVATHQDRIQGFQVMGTYDPNFMEMTGHSLDFTSTKLMEPEFLEVNVYLTHFEVGCIFDFVDPFDGRQLPPSAGRRILNLIFDVKTTAPQGAQTEIRLVNNREVSRIFNIFTVDGFSVLPKLSVGIVTVLRIVPPLPKFFIRGDVDNNQRIEITDGIALLNFLFLGGPRPRCIDAGDIQDTGQVGITDAISLLNFLFLGGPPPAVPFPNPGIDPTPDTIPECD